MAAATEKPAVITPDTKLLLKPEEAAGRLSISKRKLWELTNCGDVPVMRIGKLTLYSPLQLAEWIEANTTGGTK